MATQAHCAYCFESLTASLERRQPLTLQQVEDLWSEYIATSGVDSKLDGNENQTDVNQVKHETSPRPAAVSRLVDQSSSSSSSSSSLSVANPKPSTGTATPSSSQTSSRSSMISRATTEESHPLFVTWNTISKSGYSSLRGCIGTFQAQELSEGLRSYALTSAFEDHRFSPISASLLPSLECCVTLLTNFSEPDRDPMNWTIGKHGLRISFTHHGRRFGATYLPDVAREQGWTKEETIDSLMRKAGWNGRKGDWRKVGALEIVRYEGAKVDLEYGEWREWRDWVYAKDLEGKPLK